MKVKSCLAQDCFKALLKAKELKIHVKDVKQTEQIGMSHVTIFQKKNNEHEVVLIESGHWKKGDEKIAFTNKTQYTLRNDSLLLSHLRYKKDSPLFLVELSEKQPGLLETKTPHLCGSDCYVARMTIQENSLHLTWKIFGPKKNQEICIQFIQS